MPRKIIQKFLPHPDKIKSNRFLKIFGPVIHEPQLWHLTRHSVEKAFLIGLFFAFWPVPFQMVLAAGGAILIRANLPLSVALVWITNPVTMPFLFGFAYYVGTMTLGHASSEFEFELSWQWLEHNLKALWQPFLLGCAICAVVAGIIGYFSIGIFWRLHIRNAWNKRKLRRGKK
ncbi:MAG: DUF2062 domain-containing protein [Kangiellaceae bacterium]|nr:DUF2062 domain-containing protein [Kangiellaceae bacterium]